MAINYSFGLPQKSNYADFVTLEHFLSKEETDWLKQLWNPNASESATLSKDEGISEDYQQRKSDVMFLTPEQSLIWIFEKLGHAAIQNNAQYFQFELSGFFEELQLAKYDKEGHFDWHMDFGKTQSKRKLSLSIQLSDPETYEGGNLQFLLNNQPHDAPRGLGTLIIFPSYVMHRVTPVTSGSRMSIVGWVSGPPYR